MKLSKSVMKLCEPDRGCRHAREVRLRKPHPCKPHPSKLCPPKLCGVTLIELMIVLAIVGILATFAWPRYQDYMRDTWQAQATADLMACALALEKYYSSNFTYTGANDAGVCALNSPSEGTARYTISYQQLSASSFTLRATPVGGACGDGTCVELASDGTRNVL